MRIRWTTLSMAGSALVIAGCAGEPTSPIGGNPIKPNLAVSVPSSFNPTAQNLKICKVGTSASINVTIGATTTNYNLAAGQCQVVGTFGGSPRMTGTATELVPANTVLDSIVRIHWADGKPGTFPIRGDTTTFTGTPSASSTFGEEDGSTIIFFNRSVPPPCTLYSVNASNFNGTAIAGGRWVWFNAVVSATGVPASGGTVKLQSSTITFSANGTNYNLTVPNSTIVFDPNVSSASTSFGAGGWTTVVPASYHGNVFLGGLAYQVGAAGLPGGINPVTWKAQFSSSIPGLGLQWKWGAAVYTQFGSEATVGAKPIDGNTLNPYANSDHAGTPENFKSFVTGGARGGGGSNWTGSYSGTQSPPICVPNA